MKERPIIFSGPMVRAILAGTKTQTRRVIKPQPDVVYMSTHTRNESECHLRYSSFCPGQHLWVRETWGIVTWTEIGHLVYNDGRRPPHEEIVYRAGPHPFDRDAPHGWTEGNQWKSPISMPRAMSRIMLEITDVRIQRLQDITAEDVIAEGVKWMTVPGESSIRSFLIPKHRDCEEGGTIPEYWSGPGDHTQAFRVLWDSINAKRGYPWEQNPYVWAITFRVEPK